MGKEKDLLGNPYSQGRPNLGLGTTLSLGSTLSINTPAPIIGTSGITYKPGKYTTLRTPDLANPYSRNPSGKTDMSLKKPAEMKMDRPKSEKADENQSNTKTKNSTYIIVGVVALIGIALLLRTNNE
jgi:hypothetical protein